MSPPATQTGRPSLSPLLWAALSAWTGSLLGTELSLVAWRSVSATPVLGGWLLAAAAFVGARLFRGRAVRLCAGVGAVALAVALLHGSWLGTTATALERSGLGEWHALVVGDPVSGQFGTTVRVRLDGMSAGLVALVNWPKGAPEPALGQRVLLSSRLRSAPRGIATSDDAFRRGTLVRASPWRVRVEGWAAPPVGAVYAWRADALARLRSLDVPGCEGLASMLFGAAPTGAGAAAVEDARTAGVAWAITASGLHLAAIVMLVDRMAALFGLGRRGRVLSVLLAVCGLTLAAGLRLSLLRAALAATATSVARLAGRRRDGTAVLGAVVTGMLLVEPAAAYDVGLTLGVLAVGSIGIFGPLVRSWLSPVLGRKPAQALGASIAAQVAVAPMAAGLFGGVSLLGPVVLVISAPLVSGAVMAGAAGAAVGPFLPWPGEALLRAGSVLVDVAARIWAFVASLPGAFVATTQVPGWTGVAWALGGAALWARWPKPKRSARVRAGAALCVLLIAGGAWLRPVVSTGVMVLDVGQGDAILVRDGGHAVLIDTGPDPVVFRQALARAGVHALDGLVLTHAHADHTGGLDGLAGVARPGWIGVPDVVDGSVDALARDCARRADTVVRLRRDMTFTVGETHVRVLWPQGGETMLDTNDTSVVLLIERAGRTALLLGDAEERAQRGVLDAWALPVEMLKVAHHGSPNGNVPAALAIWRPRTALISVGKGNRFGHPSAVALASLADVGAAVSRTDQAGDLTWDASLPAEDPRALMSAASAPRRLCDNRHSGSLRAFPLGFDLWTRAWPPPTFPTSSPSTSSTAPRSCCSSAPRSGCATALRPWPTSTSTWRPSTGIPPPPRTS